MWFKNLKFYRLTDSLENDPENIEQQLQEFDFRPCGNQELATQGWVSPILGGSALSHQGAGYIWLSLKKQERLLPAAVVNAKLAEKVSKIEQETGTAPGKKAQADLKQEIIHQLLPQAFTKDSRTDGFISPKDNLVVVDASSDAKAETFLAHLRKALGSLPVVPLARRSVSAELTDWVSNKAPQGFELLEEVELREVQEEGAIIRCKNEPLDSDEIGHHLNAGKWVFKLAVQWDETLTAIIQDDLAIKRLKFTDMIREKNDDIPREELAAKLDADFTLMAAEISRFAMQLNDVLQLEQDSF